MVKNLHSLLSSNWMFSDNAEQSLYPFLINILKGQSADLTGFLNATEFTTLTESHGTVNTQKG